MNNHDFVDKWADDSWLFLSNRAACCRESTSTYTDRVWQGVLMWCQPFLSSTNMLNLHFNDVLPVNIEYICGIYTDCSCVSPTCS
jgi:hypothetical protein